MAKWRQGEHVVIVGDTGSGKTYLTSKILDKRDYVMVLRTKPDDIKFPGFHRVKKFAQMFDVKWHKYLLDPKYEEQQFHIVRALNQAWREGGWTVAIDETYYVSEILRIKMPINKLMTQGRSKHITIVAGMQRSAWVSRFTLSQATHAFIFRCEGRDLKTLGDALSPRIIEPVQSLTGHDFVYFNRVTKEVKVGNANRLNEIFD